MNVLSEPPVVEEKILLRGSEFARQFGITSSTIKYYTALGLLEVSGTTPGGMRLYNYYPTKQRLIEILRMREEGLSIREIQRRFGIVD